MSSGAKQILHYAPEVVRNTTPSPFARTVLPVSGAAIDGTVTKEDSTTILNSRIAQAGSVTGIDYAGDISAEFRYDVFDALIAGAAFNKWVANELTFGGSTRETFSFLRGYVDIGVYKTFSGCHVNTWNLSIPEQGIVQTTFGIMGMDHVAATTAPVGVVTEPTLTPTFSSVSVGNILIDGVSQVGVSCITSFEFNWDNTMQVQRCLGSGTAAGAIIETAANGTGSFTMAWSTSAGNDFYERQFSNGTLGLEVELTDALGNSYTLTIPKVEFSVPLATGARDEILTATFDYTVIEEAPILVRAAAPIPPDPEP